MNPTRSIAVALALVSAAFLSGCQTSGAGKTAENRIRLNSGAYQSEGAAVSGDIRSILMAGGLDATNPSAPTSDTSKSELAKPGAVASDTKAIVAALSDSKSTAPLPSPTVKLAAAATEPLIETTSRTSAALAMVEPPRPKPAPQKKIILDTKVETETSPTIELASINISRSEGDDAFDPLPAPEVKKPVVSSVPEKASKGDRSPAVQATGSVNVKTSRIRRF